jgi:hypothetical protein
MTSNLKSDSIFYIIISGNECPSGLNNKKSVKVSVHDSLVGGSLSITPHYCYGGTVTVPPLGSNSSTGGSGNYSYQWEISTNQGNTWDHINTAIQQTYTVSGILSQSTQYRRVVSDLCGTAYSDIITVHPIPVLSAGTDELCPDMLTPLTPSTNGIWTSDNPSIVEVVNNNTAKGVSAGSAKLTYVDTVGMGCSEEIDLKVNAYPNSSDITGTQVVCVGSTIQLSNPIPNGVWTHNNSNITLSNPITSPATVQVTGVTEGKSFITYTVFNGVCTTKMTFRIKVIPNTPPKIIIGFER